MRTFKTGTAGVIAVFSLMAGLAAPLAVLAAGPAPVDLLSLDNFAIVSKTGITDTGSHASSITGNIGSSPVTAAAMNGVFCSEMTGTIYGVDAAYVGSGSQTCFAGNPPSSNKTLADNAVLDMGTAYADAAGRTNPVATELGAGNIGGMTLAPGLYKWSTDVTIPSSVTLSGGEHDVWIFQVAGNLDISSAGSLVSGTKVVLAGGAKAANVFWQVGGVTGATLGTYSTFNGTILAAKQVIMQTGAVLHGRALAQTQVTLDASVVSTPGEAEPAVSGTPGTTTADQPFDPEGEKASATSIDDDKNLTQTQMPPNAACTPNTRVKGSGDAVYYCGSDGKRYVFPNERVYYSWYSDFSGVTTVDDVALGSIQIGGNVTYKPGLRMVKIQTDPKVYAVSAGGVLRWVQTEAIAQALYGSDWNTKVDDVSDALFANYTVGSPIVSAQ